MANITKWNAKQVVKDVSQNVAHGLGDFALDVEGESKKELERGHGVVSGTLRRSIHTAEPGYNWSADDIEPSKATPERGKQKFVATVNGKKITIQVGSGLRYALPVHQGHHSFSGYHYLAIGLKKALPKLNSHLNRYPLR